MKIFEYKKNNDKYQDKAKLYYQVMKKALPITKIFYFRHSLLFYFDNVTNYLFTQKMYFRLKT